MLVGVVMEPRAVIIQVRLMEVNTEPNIKAVCTRGVYRGISVGVGGKEWRPEESPTTVWSYGSERCGCGQ